MWTSPPEGVDTSTTGSSHSLGCFCTDTHPLEHVSLLPCGQPGGGSLYKQEGVFPLACTVATHRAVVPPCKEVGTYLDSNIVARSGHLGGCTTSPEVIIDGLDTPLSNVPVSGGTFQPLGGRPLHVSLQHPTSSLHDQDDCDVSGGAFIISWNQ